MNDDEKRQAFAVAAVGIEAEKFISSPIGKYLIGRAEGERERAITAFKECDPSNVSQILKLQSDISTPDKIVSWLVEAINLGYEKHRELREAEEGSED